MNEILFAASFIICLLVIINYLVLSILFSQNLKTKSNSVLNDYPLVSVLMAARNEESNIERCLESLFKQNYPDERFEILVGNDGSEDRTLDILRKLESKTKNLTVFDIEKVIQKKAGKMNILAQLGELAKGDVFLFTDADTWVPVNWIKVMTNEIMSGKGLVTGTTKIDERSVFGRFQSLEWVHSLAMMKVVSDLNIPVSTLGNNMGISKEAFNSVGGFAGIPFSLTEDHEIFKQVSSQGFQSFHIFDNSILAFSIPSSSLLDLLIQRKRWMKGAFQLPFSMLLLLGFNVLYYLALVTLFYFNYKIAIFIFLAKIIVQGLLIVKALKKLEEKIVWIDILLYDFYAGLINTGSLLIFFLPVKIKWKDRKY